MDADVMELEEVEAHRMIKRMTEALLEDAATPGFEIRSACAGPREGVWTPVVVISLAGRRWFCSVGTARQIAANLGASRISFENLEAVIQSFHNVAAEAERLAASLAGTTSAIVHSKELH